MATEPRKASRLMTSEGRSLLVPYGLRTRKLDDLYHAFLVARWSRVIAIVVALYLGVNLLFALAYFAVGGIENADGGFQDAFFFSVQTLATIGYGKFAPTTLAAHVVVTIEAFVGLLGVAMITGLMFAKFARPTARVLWSRVAVIAPQDGVPSLMFRIANARGNQVVEAQVRMGLLRNETTAEGKVVRRQIDLSLVRQNSMVFALSWLVIHPITPDSPLHGLTPEEMEKQDVLVFCSVLGLDESFNQTIHSRHTYAPSDLRIGERFVDIMGELPDGRFGVNYTRFHHTEPALPKARKESP